jgi:hypothetical protein
MNAHYLIIGSSALGTDWDGSGPHSSSSWNLAALKV